MIGSRELPNTRVSQNSEFDWGLVERLHNVTCRTKYSHQTWRYTCVSSDVQNISDVDVLNRQLYSPETLFVIAEIQ